MSEPRELTDDEVRDAFIEHAWVLIEYWSREPKSSTVDRLSGFAHSLLATIDGCATLPRFTLAPRPHESDAEYHRDNGQNWYPRAVTEHDIAGDLYGQLYEWARKHGRSP